MTADTIKKRKLQLFGHICRMSDTRLVKIIMSGMTDGTRSLGRPPRRWSDDIEKWCNCALPEAVRLPEEKQMYQRTIHAITGLNSSCALQALRKRSKHAQSLTSRWLTHDAMFNGAKFKSTARHLFFCICLHSPVNNINQTNGSKMFSLSVFMINIYRSQKSTDS